MEGKLRTAATVASFAVAIVLGAFAATHAGAAPPNATGEVSGRILDAGGQPLNGACVWITSGPTGGGSVSTADGGFTIGGLEPGTYAVAANDCGNGTYVPTFSGSTAWSNEATSVAVDGTPVSVGDISLVPAGTMTGRAVDPSAAPAPDLCVTLAVDDARQWSLGRTAADGRFSAVVPAATSGTIRFQDCTAEPRLLTTWAPGVTAVGDATAHQAAAGEVLDVGTTTMAAGTVVTGTVTGPDGSPVERACVSAQVVTDTEWRYQAGAQTGADGRYRFVVAPGTYSLWTTDCGSGSDLISQWSPQSPTNGERPPTIDMTAPDVQVDVTLQQGGRVSGRLTAVGGGSAAGACANVFPIGQLTGNGGGVSSTTSVDASTGDWTSDPLPAGSYAVLYSNCSNGGIWLRELHTDVYPSTIGWRAGDAVPVTVVAGTTTSGVDDDLHRAAHVSGTVTDEQGAPLAGVCIGGVWDEDATLRTDVDGHYDTAVVPGVSTELSFTDCSAMSQPIPRGAVQQTRSVEADEGGSVTLDVTMPAGTPSSVSGTLRLGSGHAVGPTCVVAYVPNNMIAVASVGADGSYRIDGLGPGRYWLGALGCDSNSNDDASPIVDAVDGTRYPATWYGGHPVVIGNGPPDPAAQGATPVVAPRSEAADFCLGDGCTTTTTTTTPTTPTTTPTIPSGPTPTPPSAPAAGGAGSKSGAARRGSSSGGNARSQGSTRSSRSSSSGSSSTGSSSGAATTSTTISPLTTTPPGAGAAAPVLGYPVARDDVDGGRDAGSRATITAGDESATAADDSGAGVPWGMAAGIGAIAALAIGVVLLVKRRHPNF